MDKHKKLLDLFRIAIGGNNNIPLVVGEVKEITGESCTVVFDTDGMELTEVRLKSTINESGNYLLTVPKIGSSVTLGSISGDLTDLCVVKVDEVERIEIVQGSLKILLDSSDNKVRIKSGDVGLLELMQSMATILKGLKVYTNMGPSGTPLPDTVAKITQFETDFKTLLK